MAFIWDAKNNFILSHSVNLHQQHSLTSNIDWSSIVSDIHLEISSTPLLLQNQYEHLLEIFSLKKDSKSLHPSLKYIYLHSLCQKIEDDSKFTLETVYELIRQARAKRIDENDFEQLIIDWDFKYSSEEQKEHKKRLFDTLNRLRDYSHKSSNNYHPSEHPNTHQSSAVISKGINEEEMKSISDNNDENLTGNQPDEFMDIDNHPLTSNINEQAKSPVIRRRTQSLTIVGGNKDGKVNVGVEWFVPKFKRQQRSSSLHARSQSPIPISSQNQTHSTGGTVITVIDDDEASHSTNNSNLRQTQAQPAISWLPLTDEQIVQNQHRQTKSKLIDEQDLEQVSSTDSDSNEVQWQTSSNKKVPESFLSHDSHQREHSSYKRQRLSEEN